MKISELANRTNVSVRTIRHYEQIGLIPLAQRKGSYRDFIEDHVKQIEFIKRCKILGFSLAEILEFMPIYEFPREQRCHKSLDFIADKKTQLLEQISQIQQKVDKLNQLQQNINQLIQS
ncbi:MerR family transcriptional regulator [Marinicellulosiphila megalodicopiae]|uniref:MerR family transcriptional regulator n=1 Tax=Marinicellulosiphila megalodicopiae TaxID=2724896 RepID=UPI003BAF1F98